MHDDSTALAVRDTDVLEPGEHTLEELVATAIAEHNASQAALMGAVLHAIKSGEALLQIRAELGAIGKEWDEWCLKSLPFGSHQAGSYMRLAFYKDQLPEEAFLPFRGDPSHVNPKGALRMASANRAIQYIRGLPPIFDNRNSNAIPKRTRAEIRRLSKQGMIPREIADLLGVSTASVQRISDPAASARYREQARAKRARDAAARRSLAAQEKRESREQAARTAGGSMAETYSLIRRALQKAEEATSQATDKELRVILGQAVAKLYQAEDAIAKALKAPA